MSKNIIAPVRAQAVIISGVTFMGIRDVKKITALFSEIGENEKTAAGLLVKTARAYYEAGNILADAIRRGETRTGKLSVKAFADASGFPQRRITLALKIFRAFENNPDALDGLMLRDALKLIAPPPEAGSDGYNRIDLGGDPGQMRFDFDELFELPPVANRSLKNYRTIGDMLSEIVIVRRTEDNRLTSKRFVSFYEDIPQSPMLRLAYKTMSQKTQAAIEDYLAAIEQEEGA